MIKAEDVKAKYFKAEAAKAEDRLARVTTIKLPHGVVTTPVFMPVGTHGVVKTLGTDELLECGSQIILGNAFHLYSCPGTDVLKTFSGLHAFMNWPGPILTDSGGFQVFSLAGVRQVDEEGVRFRLPRNGDAVFLTPELSAEIQAVIGSDIAMVLDECVALPNDEKAIELAIERSYRWAKRFIDYQREKSQLVFGIIQGGTNQSLRMQSCELTLSLAIDGVAIGGLSVGESHAEMIEVLDGLSRHLPRQLPHYLMGVGTPFDILEAVKRGIDMFDCVLPTRNARNGGFFTDDGLLNIRNAEHKFSRRPIDENCKCACCQSYTRAYLRHLFQVKEIFACRLATIHNLYYYHRFLELIREAISLHAFDAFYQRWHSRLAEAYGKNNCEAYSATFGRTELSAKGREHIENC